MKRSQWLAVSLLALMVLATVPAQESRAQSAYGEKLNVDLAGSYALWYFTYSNVNGSSHLSALESTPGLSWYNVTAIDTAGWQSDFQLFGPRGYNLLPVPFLPSQGMFLTLGSDSFQDASAAAGALDSYLLTHFISLSNGTGTFSFYSPVTFSTLIPGTLLNFVPAGAGGFASAITKSSFISTASPFVVLEGVKSGSGFSHTLVAGSITGSAVDSTGSPTLLSYFGSGISTLRSSAASSTSVIQLKTLDGIIKSSDPAVVVDNGASFTGSYTLTLGKSKGITKINATVIQQGAPLLVERAVDAGVLRTNDDLAVTLTFRNLSPTDTVTRLSFSDNWWNGTAGFKFLSGNDTVKSGSVPPSGEITPVYRLQYTGSGTGSVVIPASKVRYQYLANGVALNGTAIFNPIRLSLGVDDAVVYSILNPVGGFGKSVGQAQKLNVTVVNVGTLPASSVFVAGVSIPGGGLAAKTGSSSGGTATVTVTQSANGLVGVNITRAYGATYQNPGGTSYNATTNVVTDVFLHASMQISFPVLTVGDTISTLADSRTNLTLDFATSNLAPVNVTSFRASAPLPAGLGCGRVSGKGASCSAGVLTLSYPALNSSTTVRAYLTYNLTSPGNFIIPSIPFSGVTRGTNLTGRSNSIAVPAGIHLSKQFSPAQLFGGMSSTVQASATNQGPLPVYNATLGTTIDSFDTQTSTSALTKSAQSMPAGGSLAFNYTVTTTQTYGNLSAAPVTVSFFFGGTSFDLQGSTTKVNLYQPLSVAISTAPSTPEEGKNFTMSIVITNPTSIPVTNVRFDLPIPAGVALSGLDNAQLSSGTLTVLAGSLGPHGSAAASAHAVASSGITIPFQNAKLTFTYSGVTIAGIVPKSTGIAIAEDVTTRYLIPTALVLLVMLGVAFFVRRMASSAPSSQK